jgi:hypothetical protein
MNEKKTVVSVGCESFWYYADGRVSGWVRETGSGSV